MRLAQKIAKDGGDRSVLVIEANAHIRRLIGTLLSVLGISSVVEARSSAAFDASRLLSETAPDLIILDWASNPTDAMLFVHTVRHGGGIDPKTPILALSSCLHHSVLEHAWQCGVDDVIAKPISALEIIQRSAALLHERWTCPSAAGIMAAE